MTYKVLTYGNAVLRQKAKPVREVTDEVRELARDMLAAMRAHNGIGLAAEQVGRTEALCVIDIPAEVEIEREGKRENPEVAMPLVLVNPQITAERGTQDGQEGCLSFPEIYTTVKRAYEVDVSYTSLDNQPARLTARGLLARAIQHELDHLNGVLLIDRMSAVKRVAIAGRLKRLRAAAA